MEAREQFSEVNFLLLPCELQGSNSGQQSWQSVPLLSELAHCSMPPLLAELAHCFMAALTR